VSIYTIADAIKAFALSLQVATVFPSGIFILVNAYLFLPYIAPDQDISSAPVVTALIALTLVLSYTLYAFNFPLIRLFEGYHLTNWDWTHRRRREKIEKYRELINLIQDLDKMRLKFRNDLGFDPDTEGSPRLTKEQTEYWQTLNGKLAKAKVDLDRYYPTRVGDVLPTALGNAIAAWEDYSRTRYGMDAIALWPRLVPLLKENKYLEFVTQEKSAFDFLLNSCTISALLGIEVFYYCLYRGKPVSAVLLALAAAGLSWLLYNATIIAARQWGTTVRVAFDLYRDKLYKQLRLIPSRSFKEEVRRWEDVSEFLLYRSQEIWFNHFVSHVQIERRAKKKSEAQPS